MSKSFKFPCSTSSCTFLLFHFCDIFSTGPQACGQNPLHIHINLPSRESLDPKDGLMKPAVGRRGSGVWGGRVAFAQPQSGSAAGAD